MVVLSPSGPAQTFVLIYGRVLSHAPPPANPERVVVTSAHHHPLDAQPHSQPPPRVPQSVVDAVVSS
eukprot:354721-Pyramimonas_sp.AAC.1